MGGWATHRLLVTCVVLACAWQAVASVEPDEADRIITLLDNEVGDDTTQVDSVAMDEESQFRQFIKKHKKQYKKHEYGQRLGIFRDNIKFIRQWNSEPSNSFKVGLNALADLSDDEFASNYLNPGIDKEYKQSMAYMYSTMQQQSSRAQLGESNKYDEDDEDESEGGKYDVRWHKNTGSQPKEIDWQHMTHKRVLSKTDNQAKCFACYAFASAGAIESAVAINGGELVKLSAQQIVDCSDKFRNHRCKGGTMVKSYKYISDNGLMKDDDYGYNTLLNSSPQCKRTASKCKFNQDQVQQKVVGYVNIRPGNEKDIENAVANRPVSTAIDAHHRPFKLYRSGVFSLASCTNQLTHGLLIIGYGTEPNGDKYWKVKNSWGDTWGNGGYGKVARNKNMCAIGDWANYPIVDQADSERVSAVRSLSELGDDAHTEEVPEESDAPTADEVADKAAEAARDADSMFGPTDDYGSQVNGGFETPWNLEETQKQSLDVATQRAV